MLFPEVYQRNIWKTCPTETLLHSPSPHQQGGPDAVTDCGVSQLQPRNATTSSLLQGKRRAAKSPFSRILHLSMAKSVEESMGQATEHWTGNKLLQWQLVRKQGWSLCQVDDFSEKTPNREQHKSRRLRLERGPRGGQPGWSRVRRRQRQPWWKASQHAMCRGHSPALGTKEVRLGLQRLYGLGHSLCRTHRAWGGQHSLGRKWKGSIQSHEWLLQQSELSGNWDWEISTLVNRVLLLRWR